MFREKNSFSITINFIQYKTSIFYYLRKVSVYDSMSQVDAVALHNLSSLRDIFWIVVLGISSCRRRRAMNFFGLRTYDTHTSPTFTEVRNVPGDFYLNTLPVSLNWANRWRIDLTTGRSLPYVRQKSCWTAAMDLSLAKHTTHLTFPETGVIVWLSQENNFTATGRVQANAHAQRQGTKILL
jgi:hypothetical protein